MCTNEKANGRIYSKHTLRQLFIAVSILARDRRLIDVSSPRAIRRCITVFRLGALITFLTRKPIVARKNALLTVPRSRRLTLAAAFLRRINAAARQRATGTTTSTIYIRGTRNERSGQPYYYRLFAVRASVIMILFLWT